MAKTAAATPRARRSAGGGSSGGVAKPAARKPAARAVPPPPTGASVEAGQQAPPGKPNRPPTAFESRLYAVIQCIPPGRVTTYGALAEVLGSAPRACGQALRRNPYAPKVPCHRVIAASLELGGFSGSWGAACASVQKKRALLQGEGVPFDDAGCLLRRGAVMGSAELRCAAASVLAGKGGA